MDRPALLLAFLALILVALTKTVSAHRTTVTTIVIDDEKNPWRSQDGCGKRVHVQQLLQCRNYLSQGRQILAMRSGINEPKGQRQLQECCQQLSQVEEPCRCEGIRKVVREQSQRKQLQGRELRELVQKAQDLLSTCRVPPQQRCQIDISGAGGEAGEY